MAESCAYAVGWIFFFFPFLFFLFLALMFFNQKKGKEIVYTELLRQEDMQQAV